MTTVPGAKQTNGVLAVSASQTASNVTRLSAKSASQRLKVVIRRLAPGLTEDEFITVLGDEWKVGKGKVDWICYEPGKDSKNPSKPSRPSRAYLHLTAEAHLMILAELVRQSVFEDGQNTFADNALIGPPTVEFATYNRIPGGRRRQDARAGTIDQDPEFMSFLEALAHPGSGRELTAETLAEMASGKSEKVTTTPLVQFLKDKKASRTKDAAAKAAKKQESQSLKKPTPSPEELRKKGKDTKSIERAAKEAVRILGREASLRPAGAPSSAAQSSEDIASSPPKLDVTKVPGRQRSAVVAAHIRMLQRDLGLSPAQAHRQVRRDTVDAHKAEKAATAERRAAERASERTSEASEGSSSQAAQSPAIPTAPKGALSSRRSRAKASSSSELEPLKPPTAPSSPAPVVLLKKSETLQQGSSSAATTTAPAKLAPAAVARKISHVASPSDGATQAFIKHANPSQGVTEGLLKEAMEQYGAVSMVEIDKRKGFAYVDFVETNGLKKAMAANPIPVAQGTVQVMQRKGTSLPPEKKPPHLAPHAPSRGGRGGRGGTLGRRGGRGGRGGGVTGQGGAGDSSNSATPMNVGPAA